MLDGQIQTIRIAINPDKPGACKPPVADAWAISPELQRARRQPDTDPGACTFKDAAEWPISYPRCSRLFELRPDLGDE
ncbi:hypothetical protein ACIRYZ_45350 [Kitasatospora sp. NPDC101155]|uniref:hypothetical protein n=1 Tax=Kitasatospora sp. NPDC101155 TaxID=3364097 RepID=UPI00380CD59E